MRGDVDGGRDEGRGDRVDTALRVKKLFNTSVQAQTTHLCRPGHPSSPKSVCTGSLDLDSDVEESKLHLQMSVRRWRSRSLTLDVATALLPSG